MKLLFDQNLSHKLVDRLGDLHAGSAHARAFGMRDQDDRIIWRHAVDNGFAIVTKDGDFRQLSMLFGAPPKVIWLRIGNVPTDNVEALIRREHDAIRNFITGPGALLVLDP